ncbi:MAG: hypothetical protein QM800_00605 [Paludibacter sp.]
MKNILSCFLMLLLTVFILMSCTPTTEDPGNENTGTDPKTFKCKIDGVDFSAAYIITESTSGIISAKGLKASNGTTYANGTIRMTFKFGTSQSGILGTGNHTIVGNLPTANQPNNQNIVGVNEILINGLTGYVKEGEGQIVVEKYYESTYFQGAKGTFNNIKILTFTAAPEYKEDSVVLTNGEFDFKYTY